MVGLCMLLVNLFVDTPKNPNDMSISDAETQSRDEHEPSDNVNDNVHVDAQSRDFVARKHGKEREPWV